MTGITPHTSVADESIDHDDPLILYVLMRTDVPDYVPGKAMAQANHAGTLFATKDLPLDQASDRRDWLSEADGFGTCIVLGCTRSQMHARVLSAHHMGLVYGVVLDPTYPIRDGDQMQTLPVETCAYIFGRKSYCFPAVIDLPLF